MYENIISTFEPIDLHSMDQVSLMERIDKKFLVPAKEVGEILEEISRDYYILEINNERMLQYNTYYYDTNDDILYMSHHNGRLNRYKVRKRTYVETNTTFLEIKFKSNKGKTVKTRIPSSGDEKILTSKEKRFLRQYFPFDPNALKPKSFNGFKRITLTDRNFTERCTIDYCFRFKSDCTTIELDNFAVIEIKQERNSKSSKLYHSLFNRRIKETGFSKYCMGRSFAEENLRKNSFKPKMRELDKIIQN